MTTRCGFIAVVGQPNVGKSTLINQIVGHKVSIVTHKAQTTRQRILGIAIHETTQMIFVDTPGIFEPKQRLERAMVQAAWTAGRDSERIWVVHDGTRRALTGVKKIIEALAPRPLTLIINKIDEIPKPQLLEIAQAFSNIPHVEDIYFISAQTGEGVMELQKALAHQLPESPWLFPEDQLTDLPQRLWAAEITREQVLLNLHQEIPYEIYVETENWEEFDNGSVKIQQVVYVSRRNHKSILLGKKGGMIKELGTRARQELEKYLERKVHLFLHVKVAENWKNRPEAYRLMGLEFQESTS